MSDKTWDQRIENFYSSEFNESEPGPTIARLQEITNERPPGDAEALFELGGVHDALGQELEAISYYRQAIEAGLSGERATRVQIQLASTLRNVGATSEAITILEATSPHGMDDDAQQAFLALTYFDEGRYGDALRTALKALIPTLSGYQRALSEYANDLPSGSMRELP